MAVQIALLAKLLFIPVLLMVAQHLYHGICIRIKFQRLKKQGMPVPEPHSLLAGHLPLILKLKRLFPPDANQAYAIRELLLHWPLYFPTHQHSSSPPSAIYLDLWPLVASPILLANDPALNQLITSSERSPPRHEQSKLLARVVAGPRQLFQFEAAEHRLWRARLNPGFSTRNLQSWIAHGRLVDEVCVFAERMRKHIAAAADGDGEGWGDVFCFYPLAIDLTFDIICGLSLDFSPGEQTNGPTEFQTSFRVLVSRHLKFKSLVSLPSFLNPFWHLEYYRCHRKLDQILLPHIQRQLLQTANPPAAKGSSTTTTTTQPKTVVQLALKEATLETTKGSKTTTTTKKGFINDVLGLTKQFLFAGHDTTAVILSFAFHHLSRNPTALKQLRAEHDRVFGPGPEHHHSSSSTTTKILLRQSPHLLSALPFTTAVVKESLRLAALAGSIRQSTSTFALRDPRSGKLYPTDESFILVSSVSNTHVNPALWPAPTEFRPERWMVDDDDDDDEDPLYPRTKYAWRPFEWGPLNCIGQELAVIEIKMALLFTVRDIEFKSALDEWDDMRGRKKREALVYGDTVYQSSQALLGPPVENLPMRVRLLKRP